MKGKRRWIRIAPRPTAKRFRNLDGEKDRAMLRYIWMASKGAAPRGLGREARDAFFFKLKLNKGRGRVRRQEPVAQKRKFPCPHCAYSATFKSNLTRHQKKYH